MAGRTVAVVPARKGSKGIPRKNMRELGDRPLVAHAGRSVSGPQACGSDGNHGLSKVDVRELFGDDVEFADD